MNQQVNYVGQKSWTSSFLIYLLNPEVLALMDLDPLQDQTQICVNS